MTHLSGTDAIAESDTPDNTRGRHLEVNCATSTDRRSIHIVKKRASTYESAYRSYVDH